MAIATPSILLVLNDSSGTTVTNDGSDADVSVGQGVENTDWAWHNGEGSYDGYWESIDDKGADQAWIDCTGITGYGSTINDESCAVRFSVTSFQDSLGFIIGPSDNHPVNGGFCARITAPTSTGDFDLDCTFNTIEGGTQSHTFADLSFSTDYSLSASIDTSTVTACDALFKLDAGSNQNPATDNKTAQTLAPAGPFLGRGNDFSNYYGFVGNIYYAAYWRGYALTGTELGDVNSAPATNIPGWPSSGTPSPLVMHHLTKNIG